MSTGYSAPRREPVAPPLYAIERQVNDWNAQHPIGTHVIVRRAQNREEHTETCSQAWVLSGHSAVIMLKGISGCYSLDHVRLAPQTERSA